MRSAWLRLMILCAAVAVSGLNGVSAQEPRADRSARIAIELGPAAFSRNDVRIPGNLGTEFDMRDVIGDDAAAFLRVNAEWDLSARHGMGLVIAPLELSGTGALSADTSFAGEQFAPGDVEGEYQFSIYKLSYRYALMPRGNWHWRVGFTGLIRDANIALRQGDVAANDDDLGFVPLFHVDGEYRFAGPWTLRFDFDGLAGGPGRAFDVAFKATYDLGRRWQIGGGYRLLEGGVDTDDVYNFAWVNYLLFEVGYRL